MRSGFMEKLVVAYLSMTAMGWGPPSEFNGHGVNTLDSTPSRVEINRREVKIDPISEMGVGAEVASSSSNLWLAHNQSKRWGEMFFLLYTIFWFTLCLGIVVPFKIYESFTELEYLLWGLVSAVPSFLIPILVVGKGDSNLCWKDRYWLKASLWIIIFSYVGNYFCTHYFYRVLGASYTFPSWKMNNVPHTTFLLAHVCFLFYHVTSNITIRRLQHFVGNFSKKIQWVIKATWILALSYFIAYLETVAISNFPYYEFVDRAAMYKVGSLFYAMYFIVSFTMFSRIDENPGDRWNLPRVAIDALGASMLVIIILDLWRIFLGPIVPVPDARQCLQR
ncbi:Bifunctional protein GlmU [Sarracenia purpurea var. burkii]